MHTGEGGCCVNDLTCHDSGGLEPFIELLAFLSSVPFGTDSCTASRNGLDCLH